MKTTEHNQPSPRLPMQTPEPFHQLFVDHAVYAEIICGNQPYVICRGDQGDFQLGQTIDLDEVNDSCAVTGRWSIAEIGQVTPLFPHSVVVGLLNLKVITN